MVAFIYVGVCWVTMRPGLCSKKPRRSTGNLGPSREHDPDPLRTRAAMHALCMPRAQLALSVYSLCANSSSDIVSPRFHFRCLSTEQLRPQAPMLKLWRRRMSLFLAYVTVVVILSLTIGTLPLLVMQSSLILVW